jgi:hypothetical protein
VAQRSTKPQTEMNTMNFPGGKRRPALKSANLTAICEPIDNLSQLYRLPRPLPRLSLHLFFFALYSELCNIPFIVRFDVFTAVAMKNAVFWNVTTRGSCKSRRFGATHRINPLLYCLYSFVCCVLSERGVCCVLL